MKFLHPVKKPHSQSGGKPSELLNASNEMYKSPAAAAILAEEAKLKKGR